MFKQLKLRDIGIVVILILATIVGGYYYVNNQARTRLWQSTYPIRADLALRQVTCSQDTPDWLRTILIEKTKYQNAPANQIAYIDRSGNLYHCESGYIDNYPVVSKPISENTRFRYASVTKLWTADAILDLIRQGKFTLDTPIAKLLPDIRHPKDPRVNDITIRQLLKHQGGFNRLDIRGYDMFGIGEPICPNSLSKLNTITLNFTPGAQTSYSNLGYCLLGAVIEQVSGLSYQDYIQENYNIQKAGIQFISNQRLPDEISYNYIESGLTGVADIYTAFEYDDLYAVAGLSGSAVAATQQVQIMSNKAQPNILSLDSTENCNIEDIKDCYGYAMVAYRQSAEQPMLHYRTGTLLGLSSLVVVDDHGSVVTLLSNGTPTAAEHSNNQVLEIIYDNLKEEQ